MIMKLIDLGLKILLNTEEKKKPFSEHPGFFIKKEMEDNGLSIKHLAERIIEGRAEGEIVEIVGELIGSIVDGEVKIGKRLALELSYNFKQSPDYWLKLNKKGSSKTNEHL